MCVLFFVFFSSRRRHTRLQGDWSSDVCSSDLMNATTEEIRNSARQSSELARYVKDAANEGRSAVVGTVDVMRKIQVSVRSEERRVGKECRCRRVPDRKVQTKV